MEEKKETKYRIGMGMSIFLICFAGLFDLISLIPGAGTILGPIFWIIIGIYLWTKGMGIINGKRLVTGGLSLVAEIVPVVQELPALVAGIIIVLLIIRIEDRTGLSIVKPIQKGVTPPRISRNPVNSTPGVRPPRIKPQNYTASDEDMTLAA